MMWFRSLNVLARSRKCCQTIRLRQFCMPISNSNLHRSSSWNLQTNYCSCYLSEVSCESCTLRLNCLHLMFATICPFEIPEPESRVIWDVLPEVVGSRSPTPSLGDTVTLFPAALAYTMKIFDPDMEPPWPRPIQDIVDGPLI